MHEGLIGSGERAMSENESALRQAEAKLEELKKGYPDSVTEKEIRDQIDLINRLREDQGLINKAGM
jgi:Tfp pilus assembly protein PilX